MNRVHSKFSMLAGILALVATLSSCEDDFVRGRGDVISETRSVSTFDAVEVQDDIEVYLTQGPAEDIRVEGQGNILDILQTKVEGRELEIKFKNFKVVRKHEQVRVYITNPVLTSVEVSGAGRVEGRSDWDVNDLNVRVTGSGRIELSVKDASGIDSKITGSGNLYLKGECESHDIEVTGSGTVRAYDLVARHSYAKISGSGSCEVNVIESLKAKITGSGNVRYRGNPTVDTDISGSGRVSRVD